ncbi:MAG: hypothetical protein MJE77_20220, partial [Proteobacteria bacterium]|nr:hypothetical protein [Pseudomonadota bacterium]
TDYSIDLVEAQLDELQDRVQAAAPEDRKAIIESVIPGEQPFGIVLWPDGKIDIRGAIPVPTETAESDVAKPNALPARTPWLRDHRPGRPYRKTCHFEI